MVLCLVYGYGQKSDGRIDEQTQARCEKVLDLYKRNKIDRIFITVAARKNGIRMADDMANHFSYKGIPQKSVLVFPFGRNTAGETDVFLKIVRRLYGKFGYRVVVVSTWYHIPRIWWLWLVRRRPIRVGISWRHVHWADLKIEPLKLLNALLRPIKSSKQNPMV